MGDKGSSRVKQRVEWDKAGWVLCSAAPHQQLASVLRATCPRATCALPLPSLPPQAASHFRLLGRAVAKALQDGRLLDLPLSPLFYRLALQRRVDLYDIRRLDAGLGECLLLEVEM